ncbi:(Na+)-NQR maturation NqrM [Salinicola endophyticus]|uniref:(Na+)-NQR maturation NqrM n=1 Tax=Salinicola endophyticus TaxID=1949083 RepID=A0ABY8FN78_9GAMM|nr:(Na+)-NQR maturation NqrM [Salinicola endophyticus]WFF43118.1 (Na+)-NQR maturation NqrM [Salinicola endophyticus]
MMIWILAFALMLLLVAGMAIGVIVGRKPISGSCGGLNTLGLKNGCDICGGNDQVCEEESRKNAVGARRRSDENRGADLGYDAIKR